MRSNKCTKNGHSYTPQWAVCSCAGTLAVQVMWSFLPLHSLFIEGHLPANRTLSRSDKSLEIKEVVLETDSG